MANYGPNLIPAFDSGQWVTHNAHEQSGAFVFDRVDSSVACTIAFDKFAALTKSLRLTITVDKDVFLLPYLPNAIVTLQYSVAGVHRSYTWAPSKLATYFYPVITPASLSTASLYAADPLDPIEPADPVLDPTGAVTCVLETPVDLTESADATLTVRMYGALYELSLQASLEADAVQDFYSEYADTANEVANLNDAAFDTWHLIPLATGVTAQSNNFGGSPLRAPAFRIVNGICYVVGAVVVTPSASTTVTLGTLPTNARPSGNVYALQSSSGYRIARVYVNTNGSIVLEWVINVSDASRYASSTWVEININYPI